MFHSALVLRELASTGWMPWPSARGCVKPSTPCLSAVLPVAMEVHMIGDSGGFAAT